MTDEKEFQERIRRIEGLVHRLEAIPDAGLRAEVQELMQAVMDLHGAALDRILAIVCEHDRQPSRIVELLGDDELAGSLLLLHGLHPLDLETRARTALEGIQNVLRGYGARVDFMGAPGGAIRLNVSGVSNAPAARAVKAVIEEAVYQAAPDAVSLAILGLEHFNSPDFVSLDELRIVPPGSSNGHVPAHAGKGGG